jgi:hypothetical protein
MLWMANVVVVAVVTRFWDTMTDYNTDLDDDDDDDSVQLCLK